MPVSIGAAKALASSLDTRATWRGRTPRWLERLLPTVTVASGMYKVNRVVQPAAPTFGHAEGTALRATFADYQVAPAVLSLRPIEALVEMHTRVSELFSHPYDQLDEQLRLAIDAICEEKERQTLVSADFGLLQLAAPEQRLHPALDGPPTPDDLDELLSLVWKDPAFFVAHPAAIAAFEKQCNARGLPLETVELYGRPFATWRGVPLVPSDKVPLGAGARGQRESSIALLRVGEEQQGVVQLRRPRHKHELRGVALKQMGVNPQGISTHLLSCYFGLAVLTEDALAVLEGVRV